MTRDSE